MAAKDRFHEAVKRGLQKEQWLITHDPLTLEFSEDDEVEIDLGAEQLLGAEKGLKKIAVEVKSFLSESALYDFHRALGQFLNYRLVIEAIEPERILYLAVPIAAYESFFKRELPQASVRRYQVKLIVYDPVKEAIVKWID
ncbi:MAG TPA: fatty-acid oxidation protein subunit alpha [Cyanobacteria bacterium UBA11369]|nr:fatty-acid oxidation protein subunit alpha [Cyanobacteria bacterium UBA11371]HBE31985.1 fatty-acid oxidation protein subunit alpha [Cyanobacteria bacterium UBA11368]HBE48370.1 fatty-acid oxidation protein subunit alpha [Cyanobacteria bacterium UBA11369]